MSGVEILANSLQANLEQTWIKRASPTFSLLCCLLPVLVLCFFMKRSSPRTTLLLSLLTIALILLTHGFMMYKFGLWYNPLPSILGILLLYPLWSWRTQEMALYQMHHEIAELNEKEPCLKQRLKTGRLSITANPLMTGFQNSGNYGASPKFATIHYGWHQSHA